MLARAKPKMCIVNPVLVADIASLTGSQTEIMRRIGISWNSWIKICAGLPIRLSVGRRLRDRLLQAAPGVEGFRHRFPDPASADGIHWKALEAAFLLPANISGEAPQNVPLRSVGRALQMLSARRYVFEASLHP